MSHDGFLAHTQHGGIQRNALKIRDLLVESWEHGGRMRDTRYKAQGTVPRCTRNESVQADKYVPNLNPKVSAKSYSSYYNPTADSNLRDS